MAKKEIYCIAAGHLSADLATGALPATLPFLVSERGMSYTEVAGLMFALAFLSSLMQPLFGWLADRVSRHWFMGVGIATSCGMLGAMGLCESYWAMFAMVSLMGAGNAMFHPEAARLVNLIAGAGHRGQGMATFSVGGNIGFAFGPLLAVAAISQFGLPGLAVFSAFGLAMGGALLAAVPRIARNAAASSPGRKASRDGAGGDAPGRNNWPAFLRLTLVLLGRSTLFNGIMTFLPLYCIHALQASNAAGSAVLSAFSLAGIAMTLAGGWLADRLGLVATARATTLAMAPALLLVLLAPGMWAIYALLPLLCFGLHGIYSPMVVLGQTYLARNIGFASGVTLGLSMSFGGLVSPLMGQLADRAGIDAVLWLLAGVGALCAAGAFLLPPASSRK